MHLFLGICMGFLGFHFGTMEEWFSGLGLELLVMVVSFVIIYRLPNTLSFVPASKISFPNREKLIMPFIVISLGVICGLCYLALFQSAPFLYFQF